MTRLGSIFWLFQWICFTCMYNSHEKLLTHSYPENLCRKTPNLVVHKNNETSPGWSITHETTDTCFNSMGLDDKFIKSFPPAKWLSRILTVRFATIEKQAPFFPPNRAKQKHHTLVSKFIYPITSAHVYTIKSAWLLERELNLTAEKQKENSSTCLAKPRKRSIQEWDTRQLALK